MVYLLLCLLWLGFILGHSAMPAEQSHAESTAVLWSMERFFPFLTHKMVRKLAHFTEFFLLGCLLTGFFAQPPKGSVLAPVLAGLLCAMMDETIQLYVPGRSGQITDVWLDAAGAAAAVVVLTLARCLLRRRRSSC